MAHKRLLFSADARVKVLGGATQIADAVLALAPAADRSTQREVWHGDSNSRAHESSRNHDLDPPVRRAC